MKIKYSAYSLFLTAVLGCLTACGGSTKPQTVTTAAADVFVAGLVDENNVSTAVYWQNGVPTRLPDLGHGAEAYSIAVVGSDVYVAGTEGSSGSQDLAVYWKNGIPVVLTDGTKRGLASSIFVSGSDVYVAGNEDRIAEYWKNGVPVALTDDISGAQANAITVSGTDVYVAGYQDKTTILDPTHTLTVQVAKYWKNGVPVELTTGLEPAIAFSISVSGTDVYVAGWENRTLTGGGIAKYWKNGAAVELTTQPNTWASSIVASGANVYVAANITQGGSTLNNLAETWQNGTIQSLNTGNDNVAANQLAVFGTDVYVVGTAGINAVVWKNGVSTPLTDGSNFAMANSIAVVSH